MAHVGRRRIRPAVVVGACCLVAAVACVLIGGVALLRALNPESPDGLQPPQRLAHLKAVLASDPLPPEGATLVSRIEHAGNNLSDGPAVDWEYRFDGTSSDFVEHYRVALTGRGWTEETPGNLPGQLTNFGKISQGTHYVIAIFAPGQDPNFRLQAFA